MTANRLGDLTKVVPESQQVDPSISMEWNGERVAKGAKVTIRTVMVALATLNTQHSALH